jgi:1-pyrroline-5-carboxylate dehydrogenase
MTLLNCTAPNESTKTANENNHSTNQYWRLQVAFPPPEEIRMTYTTADVDMAAFHHYFDEALAKIRTECDATHPLYIANEAVTVAAEPMVNTSPINSDWVLGKFQAASPAEIDRAVAAAKGAKPAWAAMPWQERITLMRKAAELVRARKFEIAAIMSIEVGKNRFEAIGDAEESADLIDYYCDQMEEANGFVREMNRITPIETNTDVLRPYGVFACIAPFNFPMALSCGMSSAALIAGNTVVYKPAKDAPWTGLKMYEVYRDAGLPAGVFNFVTGRGSDIGDALVLHKDVDGVVFTGSKKVGMRMFHSLSDKWVKPCLMELGGKNPAIVMETADLDAAADGVSKSAWGLQNQKCSACSRVYVHETVVDEFVEKLMARTNDIVIGDPTQADVYLGPVINGAAVSTYEAAVAQAKKDGEVLIGGERLTDGDLSKGHYVAPTIVKAPLESSLFTEEFFVPILAVGTISSLDQALEEANKVEYGLTAGLFSGKEEEIEQFWAEIEAGVTYVNKRTGATTGAWPGAQPFCGWKGSGGSGKGGCGPYYVMQFMREQCRTRVREV